MNTMEIFKSGTHTDSGGATITFSEADIAALAESYDPALSEAPLVVGHPKTDDPAWGWVKALSAKDGRLFAEAGRRLLGRGERKSPGSARQTTWTCLCMGYRGTRIGKNHCARECYGEISES